MAKNKKLNPPNYTLLGITIALVFLGIAAIGSASQVVSWDNHGNTYHYLVHQLIYGIVPGFFAMVLLSKIPYKFWQKIAPFILFVSIGLLIAVLLPGVGLSIGGAQRWLDFGFITFQPSELAKLALIIYLAAWFAKKEEKLDSFKFHFLPPFLIVLFTGGLIYLQPDIGTLMVLCMIAVIMFFAAGIKIYHLATVGAAALAALVLAIGAAPYRAARIITFLDPSHDPQGIGYHVNQALLAVGSGGLLGFGYNRSLQKYNYLPEPMGDSIFAIMAEELGFIRVSLVIIMFVIFAVASYKIAQNIKDKFGRLLVIGIASWITLQAFVNIAAMLALLPLTGIPLPFISYGSSALIITMAGVGIMLNVSREAA